MSRNVAALLGLLVLLGCNKSPPEPESSSRPGSAPEQSAPSASDGVKAESTAKAEAARTDQPASGQAPVAAAPAADELGVEWTDPPGWTRAPSASAMRKATLTVPAAEGDSEPGELAVFYFGAEQGGGVDQNLDRWVGQFQNVPEGGTTRSERKVGDLTQHVVEVSSGTYAGSMMGGPAKADFGMLAAVVVAPSGKYFFKLTGPKNTVAKAREGFTGMLDSMKAAAP